LKIQKYWHLSNFIIIVFAVYLSGCSSFGPTKPNNPYAGNSHPTVLNELTLTNSLLLNELGKLPELQDGVSEKEMSALNNLANLYKNDPNNFESAFTEMYKVGLPEHRKYCSPLQAFYWLLVDGAAEEARIVLNDYSLIRLLNYSWVFRNTEHIFYWKWKTKEARLLYQRCSDHSLIDKIDRFEKENKVATGYIIDLAQKFPDKFEYIYDETNYYESLSKTKKRWSHFNTVVERLNAPDLLDFYINGNMKYVKNSRNSHSPKHTFNNSWGDCDDLAVFGKYILRKGGYAASIRYVHWTSDNRGHAGVVIKIEDNRYVIAVDFGNSSMNMMSRPHTSISDVDIILSKGHAFHDSGWWRQPN